jgi:hypothetical protein
MTQHHELGPSPPTQTIASLPLESLSFFLFLRPSVGRVRFSNRNIPLLEALLTLAKPMTSKFLIATRSLVPDSTTLAGAKLLSAALPITQEGIGVREAILAALLLPFGAPGWRGRLSQLEARWLEDYFRFLRADSCAARFGGSN